MGRVKPSRRNRLGLWTQSQTVLEFARSLTYSLESKRQRAFPARERDLCHEHMVLVLLDLLSAMETSEDLWIGYSRGKKNFLKGGSYWNEELGKPFLSERFFLGVVDFLSKIGLIENVKAPAGFTPYSSRMQSSEALRVEFAKRGISWTCIVASDQAPVIVVKDEDKKPTSWPHPGNFPLDEAITNLRRINSKRFPDPLLPLLS